MSEGELAVKTLNLLRGDRRGNVASLSGVNKVPSTVFDARVVGDEMLLVFPTGPHHDQTRHVSVPINRATRLKLLQNGSNSDSVLSPRREAILANRKHR